MSVFGVDIGNLNTVVSVARRGGVDVIANEISKRETESYVSFDPAENGERYIGAKGADQKMRNWRNTVTHIKRLIGVKFDSPQMDVERKHCLYRLSPSDDGFALVTVNYDGEERTFRPEQLMAMLLQKMASFASREACEEVKGMVKAVVKDCVVSCPAYYSAVQRKLLLNATQIAGLNCLAIVTEQTAACLDWGIYKNAGLPEKEEDAHLVYIVDLGHSASVITGCAFWQGNLRVLGHVYDKNLGTRDIDQALLGHFRDAILQKYKIDVYENKKARVRLIDACAKLRIMLSANPQASLSVESLMEDIDVHFPKYERCELEELLQPFFGKFQALVDKALAIPGMVPEKVVSLELIGGGSRIPKLKQMLSDAFGKPLSTTLNASESIAKGCGIIGAIISPKFRVRDFVVQDSNPFPIQLGYHSSLADTASPCSFIPTINKSIDLFPANVAFPKVFDLKFDRSENFDLHVYYKEPCPDVLDTCGTLQIGHWSFTDLPPCRNLAGEVDKDKPVTVTIRFRLNNSGIVAVESASVTEAYEVEEEKWVEKKIEEGEKQEEEKKEGSPKGSPKKDEKKDDKKDEKKEEKPQTKKVKEIVKKKKTRKIEVNVMPHIILGLTTDMVEKLAKAEAQMLAKDTLIAETLDAKNALESYSYDYRDKIGEGGQLHEYLDQATREAFNQALKATEAWIYEEGENETKEVYAGRLKELRKPGDAAWARLNHRETLPLAVKEAEADILSTLDEANKLLHTHKTETPTHIPADKLEEILKKGEDSLKTIREERQKIDEAPKYQDFEFGPADVKRKAKEVKDFAKPIFSTPKPQPPKEDKDEKKDEKKENGHGADKDAKSPKAEEKGASPRREGKEAPAEEGAAGMDVD